MLVVSAFERCCNFYAPQTISIGSNHNERCRPGYGVLSPVSMHKKPGAIFCMCI